MEKAGTEKRIRIVFLIHRLRLAGLENFVVNLSNILDPAQFECTIVSFARPDPLQNRVKKEKVKVVSFDKKDGNDPKLVYRLFQCFRHSKPHIIQTHNWGTLLEGIFSGMLARVPVIIHAERGTVEKRLRNIMVQWCFLRMVDQVLSVSEAHRRRLSDTTHFPREKIKPIPNGVDTDLFCPRPSEKKNVRWKIGLEPDGIYIGVVGNLRTVKNHALLLRAGKNICQKHVKVQFVFIGSGPLKNHLIDLAKDLGISGRVRVLGARSDIPDILNALDIFVLPSLNEGMPNAVLEAMASGLPVVATHVGGIPEIISNEKTGILVPSQNEKALEAALEDLLQHERKRQLLGENGRQSILDCFSLKRMVDTYQNLYRSLVKGKKA